MTRLTRIANDKTLRDEEAEELWDKVLDDYIVKLHKLYQSNPKVRTSVQL